jgi:hypothetical protein
MATLDADDWAALTTLLLTSGVRLADGVAHGGTPGSSTATFAMRMMQLANSTGRALDISATGDNDNAIHVSCGTGYGSAFFLAGGTTNGSGIYAIGGNSGGSGITAFGTAGNGFEAISSSGHGFYCEGYNGSGLFASGSGAPALACAVANGDHPGASFIGKGTGCGLFAVGGVDGGAGAVFAADIADLSLAGNGLGMLITGGGAAALAAVMASGGDGPAVLIDGSDAQYAGIIITATDAPAVSVVGVGNSSDAVGLSIVGAGPDTVLAGTLGDQVAGDVDNIVLPSGPADNGILVGSRLRITSGAAQYQERTITTWDGTGKIAGVDEPFSGGLPASGDTFEVRHDHSHQLSSGNVLATGQVSSFQAGALAQLFTLDSTKTRVDAVVGSIVGEIITQINTRLASSGYTSPNNGGIASILSLVGSMPVGMAGVVQDTGATTALVHTSGLPTSGTFPAAGAKLLIIWTSGPLAGRTVKGTYTAGAAGTQRLAFSPVLPTAPANGDTFAALEIPG